MKSIFAAVLLTSILSSGAVMAQSNDSDRMNRNDGRYESDRNDENRRGQDSRRDRGHDSDWQRNGPRRSRGEYMPRGYMQNHYNVSNWNERHLRAPPRGHRWVRNDRNDYFLVLISTGVLIEVVYHDERDGRDWRDDRWRRRYSRSYSYHDDHYYRECRNSADPGGILAGALIGGLLGNAAGHGRDRAGTTIAGVVVGGAVGAALTSNLNCDDRSYAYRTYSDAFNSGHTGRPYQWRNPQNDHRGEFQVSNYYDDQDGFRCANYTQTVYIGGRPQNAIGRACRQPDGAWVIVN